MLSPVPPWVAKKTALGPAPNRLALEHWQFARLREQLAYARKNSPYYAECLRDVNIANIRGRADLPLLPLTPAPALREAPQQLLCGGGSQAARIVTLNTSGSSGDTKRIWFSAADLERTVEFFACGLSAMVKPGYQVLVLLSDNKPHSLGELLRRALGNLKADPLIHGYMRETAAAIAAARNAQCVIGLPAQLNRLCLSAPQLRPVTVLLTADYVPQGIAANIRRLWGSSVFTHYGLTESGFGLAVQCQAQQAYHLRDAEFIVEIIGPASGQVLPDGQWGEVVLTSLVNEAMPLLRYRSGDLSRRIIEPCACGGGWPRLDKIKGRINDLAQPYPISALDEALFSLPGLLDYTAKLLPAGGLALTVDSPQTYDEATLRQALEEQGLKPPLLELHYSSLPVFSGPAKRQVLTPATGAMSKS